MIAFLFLMVLALGIVVGYLGKEIKKLKQRLHEAHLAFTRIVQQLEQIQQHIERDTSGATSQQEVHLETADSSDHMTQKTEELSLDTDMVQQVPSTEVDMPIPIIEEMGLATDEAVSSCEEANEELVELKVPVATSNLQLSTTYTERSRTEWEMLIGGKWLNRVGALALVIGLAFFIKYAFDNNWINEVVRVISGGVVGFLLLWGGERSHQKELAIFGQGLIGAGIATLYVSVFASFNFYHFVSLEIAFLLMSLVTIIAFQQALRYNALAISLLGWLGGFLTPFLLRTEAESAIGLFTYLSFLTCGMLGIVWKKKNWSILYYLTLFAVYMIYFSWILSHSLNEQFASNLLFLLIFWGLFFIYEYMTSLQSVQWPVARFITAICNTVFLFVGSIVLIQANYHKWLGTATFLMSAIYLVPLLILKWLEKLSRISKMEQARFGYTFYVLLTIACALEWEKVDLIYAWTIEATLITCWALNNRIQGAIWFGIGLYGITVLGLIGLTSTEIDPSLNWIPVLNPYAFAYVLLVAGIAGNAHFIKRWKLEEDKLIYHLLHVAWAFLVFVWITAETQLYFDRLLLQGMGTLRFSVEYHRYLINMIIWLGYSLFVAWIGYRRTIYPLVYFSWLVLGAGVAGAAAWSFTFADLDLYTPVYNLRFFTLLSTVGTLFLHLRWWKREQDVLPKAKVPIVLTTAMAALFFECISVEIVDVFNKELIGKTGIIVEKIVFTKAITLYIGWFLYSIAISWISYRFRMKVLRFISWVIMGLGVMGSFFQSFFYPGIQEFVPVINLRFLLIVVATLACWVQLWWWRKKEGEPQLKWVPLVCTFTIAILLFELVTVEIGDYFDRVQYMADPSNVQLRTQIGYQEQMTLSISWILYSLGLMIVGIWRKMQSLRLIAFGLFGISIMKIFLFDLSFLGTLYRIFSFMGLGVVLLFVSYIYQRYKHWFHTSA